MKIFGDKCRITVPIDSNLNTIFLGICGLTNEITGKIENERIEYTLTNISDCFNKMTDYYMTLEKANKDNLRETYTLLFGYFMAKINNDWLYDWPSMWPK